MKKKRNTYCLLHKSSAVFMILALVWLTVSTPFVTAFKQEMAKQVKMENTQSPLAGAEEDTNIPGSNTEEKTPASPTSFSEEYIHDLHTTHYFLSASSRTYKCTNADTYTAFHGELLVPPPNAA